MSLSMPFNTVYDRRDSPVPLSADENEIQFYCGSEENLLDSTLPLQEEGMVDGIEREQIPQQLMEEDPVHLRRNNVPFI